jgi:hypothetical protein
MLIVSLFLDLWLIHRDIDTQMGYSVASPQVEDCALLLPREVSDYTGITEPDMRTA